jgi:hypothetical protein
MTRLTIDIPEARHAEFEAHAFSQGMKLDEFAIQSMEAQISNVPEMTDDEALKMLDNHLAPALEQTKRGETIPFDINAIKRKARERNGLA